MPGKGDAWVGLYVSGIRLDTTARLAGSQRQLEQARELMGSGRPAAAGRRRRRKMARRSAERGLRAGYLAPAMSANSTSRVVNEQKRGRPGSLLLEGVAGSSMRCWAGLKGVETQMCYCRKAGEGLRSRLQHAMGNLLRWWGALRLPSPPGHRFVALRGSGQGRGGARHRRPELAP